ncbi:agamous-like MADS-box protein AGL36 [Solanum lycopersicum]|uniref:agamous-like MADS-box protein AGL36 n=1 Tax=Solanum lycopersicum TaxID=4081 RepID=UPI0002BCC082|nr:MADS-box transcription factor PHERES 2-like [Solanum lycopersicum]
MATKRLRDSRNYSENVRNSILDRREISLFKKAEELSILCDVEAAIIIFRPGKIQPIAWKSASLAQDVLTRYLSFLEFKRLDKLVTHEDYLQKLVDKKEEQITKLQKMNEAKEMEILFNQLVEGKSIDELDVREMKGLLKVFAAKMAKLDERKKELNHAPNPPSNKENITLSASPMEESFNDPWFIQSIATLGDGSGIESTPKEGNGVNVEYDGHSKDLD